MNKYDISSDVPTMDQFSAGGVAFRRVNDRISITIVHMLPDLRWQLPKGIIDPGETAEVAAQREVREEAGIETELLGTLGQTQYWFHADRDGVRTRFHKFVSWYLMRYSGGDVADHDHEVAESRWVSIEEALAMLVFKNEREMVEKAELMIGELGE